MDLDTDIQNPVQNSPQEQVQANPPSATVPETPPPISAKELRALGKTFGHIPGVPIFTEWEKRKDCLGSAVHRAVLNGICGNSKDGAFSVVLSDSYKDDEDGGDTIIYTGAGGRQKWTDTFPPKRLRVGPQIFDQSWDYQGNSALKLSSHTGKPIRVVRSWKCNSRYAPAKGYRYDGLYIVAVCWTAKGFNGKDICRCRLERLPGQPPIPLRPVTLSTSKRRRRMPLVTRPTFCQSTSTDSHDSDMSGESDVSPNESNTAPAQSVGRFLSPPPPQAVSETSTEMDFDMGEVDLDVKDPQLLPPQRQVPANDSNSGALPRYRWDARKNELVKVPTVHTTPEIFYRGEGNEGENRAEDDATLVPSDHEDGHADMPVVDPERMETEYFSEVGNSS